MKVDRLKRIATAEKTAVASPPSYKDTLQQQKIDFLRFTPDKKDKHTLNSLPNETLADFLELCMKEEKSQAEMLKELIETFKKQ